MSRCSAKHKLRLIDAQPGLGKAYLRLLGDEIQLEDNELKIQGSYRRLADALRRMERTRLSEVFPC
jgi:hypothetical protein